MNNGGSEAQFPGCAGSHKGRKSLFPPGTSSINLPSSTALEMGVLHHNTIGQMLLTAAGHSSCLPSMLCQGVSFPSRTGHEPQGKQIIWGVRGAARAKGDPKILLAALFQSSLKPAFLGSCGAATENLNSASMGQQNAALSVQGASAPATVSVRLSLGWRCPPHLVSGSKCYKDRERLGQRQRGQTVTVSTGMQQNAR